MIKGKKAVWKQLQGMVLLVVAALVLIFFFVNSVDNSKNQASEQLNITKYLPEKILNIFKDDISSEVKDYLYEFTYLILLDEDTSTSEKPTTGRLILVPTQEIGDGVRYVIGFKKYESKDDWFIYLKKDSKEIIGDSSVGSASVSDAFLTQYDLLSETQNEDLDKKLHEKKFVVMPQINDKYFDKNTDALLLLHYITEIGLARESDKDRVKALDEKAKTLTDPKDAIITALLKKYEVNQVAFSGDAETKIFFKSPKGPTRAAVSLKKQKYMLVYHYKNYIVFFPFQSNMASYFFEDGLELTGSQMSVGLNGNNHLAGGGFVDDQLHTDLEKLGYTIAR